MNNKTNNQTFDELATSIQCGNKSEIQYFLENGGNPNLKDIVNTSLLHKAAEYGQIEIFNMLLNAGAYINATNDFGKTPLYKATESEIHNNAPMIIYIVRCGADINISKVCGNTTLHQIGSKRKYHDLYSFMVSQGGDESAKNESGETPRYLFEKMKELNRCASCKQTIN